MRRGQVMEDYVCRLYAEHLGDGCELIDTGLVRHPSSPHVFGTPDRMVRQGGVEFGMDAKTRRSSRGWGARGEAIVPLDVEIQMRVYMEVTDAPYWDIATSFSLDDFRVYRLERDIELGKDIIEVAESWWTNHVIADEPPPTDGSALCKKVIEKLHAKPTSEILRTPTPLEVELHRELLEIRAQHKLVSARKEELENEIRSYIGDDIGIDGVATWKPRRDREVFEQARFKEEHPDLCQEYIIKKPSGRVLRILGDKP